jgi:hypothetical protein
VAIVTGVLLDHVDVDPAEADVLSAEAASVGKSTGGAALAGAGDLGAPGGEGVAQGGALGQFEAAVGTMRICLRVVDGRSLFSGEHPAEPVPLDFRHVLDEAGQREGGRRRGCGGGLLIVEAVALHGEGGYDSDEHASAWLESDKRKQLLREGERFKEFELHRISSPFGSWFAPPDGDEEQGGPPNWKTGLSVLVGLYPTVVVLTLAISEIWPKGPLWATLLVGNICPVSLLTWVVMPVVTRALRFWLVPGRQISSARLDFIGAAASVGFLTIAGAGVLALHHANLALALRRT